MKSPVHLLLLLCIHFISNAASAAQPAFYNRNTVIKAVDCAARSVSVRIDRELVRQLSIDSNASTEKAANLCRNLSAFVEGGQSDQAGKVITLMTVESKSTGDSIYEQEVIGFVDVDYIRTTKDSIDEIEPVYNYYCGTLGADPRSSAHICMMISRDGHYFFKLTSPQQYRLMKTSTSSSDEQHLILQSKNRDGSTEMNVEVTKIDDETFDVKVSFGSGVTPAVLKKQMTVRSDRLRM